MSENYRLSRPLPEDEVAGDANETLEEARTVDRRPGASGQRATASEEKAGTEGKASAEPAPAPRPAFKPPPFEPPAQ